jgi:hypothetical protein
VSVLAFLLLLAAPEDVTARWSLEGPDLAVWEVYSIPEEDWRHDMERTPNLRLGIFGYQVDEEKGAEFPTHLLEEIAYDLALKVPLGKIRKGDGAEWRIGYSQMRDHVPIEVHLDGTVTEMDGARITLKGTATGGPAKRIDRNIPGRRRWFTEISAEVETTFDCDRGVMETSTVHLRIHSTPRRDAFPEQMPDPTEAKYRFRFKLKEIRRYDPEWFDKPWKMNTPIGHAIIRGTEWVRSQVGEDGSCRAYDDKYPYGPTCLAALTLLRCGVDREDPLIGRLMETIRSCQPIHTYEISIALMAMEAFYAPADEVADIHAGKADVPWRRKVAKEDLRWMTRLADRLLRIKEHRAKGWGWGYDEETPRWDLSNTQYAALGLLAAWRCGVEIHEEVWIQMAEGLLLYQSKGEEIALRLVRVGEKERRKTRAGRRVKARGLGYYPNDQAPKGSMTCGGLSALRICRDILRAERSRAFGKKGLDRKVDAALDEGWAWMASHWMIQRHAPDHGRSWILYYLYSLERAGVLCRVRKVNGHDWYYEGAAWLLATQGEDGHWEGSRSTLVDTCFALLFLKRATIPVPERTGSSRR